MRHLVFWIFVFNQSFAADICVIARAQEIVSQKTSQFIDLLRKKISSKSRPKLEKAIDEIKEVKTKPKRPFCKDGKNVSQEWSFIEEGKWDGFLTSLHQNCLGGDFFIEQQFTDRSRKLVLISHAKKTQIVVDYDWGYLTAMNITTSSAGADFLNKDNRLVLEHDGSCSKSVTQKAQIELKKFSSGTFIPPDIYREEFIRTRTRLMGKSHVLLGGQKLRGSLARLPCL